MKLKEKRLGINRNNLKTRVGVGIHWGVSGHLPLRTKRKNFGKKGGLE